jgi:hypothetical protein
MRFVLIKYNGVSVFKWILITNQYSVCWYVSWVSLQIWIRESGCCVVGCTVPSCTGRLTSVPLDLGQLLPLAHRQAILVFDHRRRAMSIAGRRTFIGDKIKQHDDLTIESKRRVMFVGAP